jgi:hypothetical protein
MAAVELGKGPSQGFNSTSTATDISSPDETRTLGAFNTGRFHEPVAVLGHSDHGVGVRGEGFPGVEGKGDGNATGVRAESGSGTALLAETRGGICILLRQTGNGDIIVGRDRREAGVFRVLASGEVQSRGVVLTSDRNAKTNFANVNTRQILEKLACMPIQDWNYKADPTSVRHIGPTSQDFQVAFGLNGGDDVHISTVDAQGIALAAIQGLNEKLQAENTQLRVRFASLEARLAALESKTEPKAGSFTHEP